MPDRDPYKILQVDPEADPEVITAAYRVLARRLHPDRDASGIAEVRMAELNRAYALLRDPARRKEHDASVVAAGQVPVGPGPAPGRLDPSTLAGRVEARRNGDDGAEMELDFGRYRGWTLGALARQDPDYLRWLSRHSSGIRYRRAILRLLPDETPDPVATQKR